MPADQTKLTVYNPKVEQNPRDLICSRDKRFVREEEDMRLALRIASEDPTERDCLTANVSRARARLKAAAGELLLAAAALLFAWLSRALLNRAYRKVTESRGDVGRAERGVLALEYLLGGLLIRRVFGRARLLRALGAKHRTDDEGNAIYSMGLAERRYRPGEGPSGFGNYGLEAARCLDLPAVRVVVGVRIAAGTEPVWCLKRFAATECGGYTEIHRSSVTDAGTALLHFYLEPSHDEPVEHVAPVADDAGPSRQRSQQAA